MSIGKFKLQVSFSVGLFEIHFGFLLYIWERVDFRPVSQQIYVVRTRMWLEKTLPNIRFMKKNKYLEDICSMNGWSDKKSYFKLFSRHNPTALHTKFHICETPFRFFEEKKTRKYLTNYVKPNIHSKILTILHHLEEK